MAATLSHRQLSPGFPFQSPGAQAPISEPLSSVLSVPLEADSACRFAASTWLQRKTCSTLAAPARLMRKEISACLGVSESRGLILRLVFIPGASQLLLNASPINCEISSSESVSTGLSSFRFVKFVLLPGEEQIIYTIQV